MTDTNTTFGTFTYESATRRSAAEARGLRRAVALAAAAATLFAATALFSATQPTAMPLEAEADGSYLVAYAEPEQNRFGVLDGVFGDDNHEMNDAWMGMEVISADGIMLGYVSDAFVNPDGSVDELVITPSGEDSPFFAPVYLPARYAELGLDAVRISLGATRAVATLTPADDLAYLPL